ncbi:YybH family protein [Dokdonella soli]|uniref:SnoaL-like domain-containing protein n=1 Tax=Dokdonella soli TaxID=529810 RepID=A0ABN1IF12_9GAMM
MSEPHDPFLQAMDSYKAAVRAKDVDAFLAIYDDDVHVFDLWGTWSLRGIVAWRNMAADWFSSLGTEQVVVSVDEAQTTRIGDLAVGHAVLTYTAMSAEGKELRSLNNRITMALRRTGESWKIFHEHTSAPVDHRSAKAILKRAGDS